jgi:hypothetical protein
MCKVASGLLEVAGAAGGGTSGMRGSLTDFPTQCTVLVSARTFYNHHYN